MGLISRWFVGQCGLEEGIAAQLRARLWALSLTKREAAGTMKKASLELKSRLRWGFTLSTRARVAELADALASGASDRKVVEVRVLSRAPSNYIMMPRLRAAAPLPQAAHLIASRRLAS